MIRFLCVKIHPYFHSYKFCKIYRKILFPLLRAPGDKLLATVLISPLEFHTGTCSYDLLKLEIRGLISDNSGMTSAPDKKG